MNCSKCGQVVDDGAQFCGNCGQPVGVVASDHSPTPTPPPGALIHGVPGSLSSPNQPLNGQIAPVVPITTALKSRDNLAMAGLVLGIVSIVAAIVPIFGLPIGVTGFILSLRGLKSYKSGQATAGLVLSAIGLVLTVVSAIIGWNYVQPTTDSKQPAINGAGAVIWSKSKPVDNNFHPDLPYPYVE